MVYARNVDGTTLTFSVSGQLWNRSLVMLDSPTGSLWSHILGEAIEGKLKGKRLAVLPSEMTTWADWRRRHPKTTLLALSRTSRNYTRDFYKRRPAAFVYGWMAAGRAFHVPLPKLTLQRAINGSCNGVALLAVYDPESTGARLFSRTVDRRVLDFEPHADGRLRDRQTGSVWDPAAGTAIEGDLAGKRLAPAPGLMSYARAWRTFHPGSKEP